MLDSEADLTLYQVDCFDINLSLFIIQVSLGKSALLLRFKTDRSSFKMEDNSSQPSTSPQTHHASPGTLGAITFEPLPQEVRTNFEGLTPGEF